MIKCLKCQSLILPENEKLSCHAHNDTNRWVPIDKPSLDLSEVFRTKVIEDKGEGDE